MHVVSKVALFSTAVSIMLFSGCSTNPVNQSQKADSVPLEQQLVLGKKLDDPFTTASVKAALASLVQSRAQGLSKQAQSQLAAVEIKPNYLYIRYLVENKEQESMLQRYDTSLVMFTTPMDQEVLQEGVDVSLPQGVKAYYAAVPLGYDFFDGARYEVLKELYLVDPVRDSLDAVLALAKSAQQQLDPVMSLLQAYGIDPTELEMEALRLTGNLEPRSAGAHSDGLQKSAAKSKQWTPSGRITYEDDELGKTPVEGARITFGYWYYWHTKRTNSNGEFKSSSSWTWNVDYKLHWDAEDFVFQKQSHISGPSGSREPWNRHMTGKYACIAASFAGAWMYYYGNIDGLRRPHQNGWTTAKLDYEIEDSYSSENLAYFDVNGLWVFSAQTIKIYLKQSSGRYMPPCFCFLAAVHETAHNVHYKHFETRYWANQRINEFKDKMDTSLKDSYAAGVDFFLCNKRYGWNDRPNGYIGNYTGICQDLRDTDPTIASRSRLGKDLENVHGFTMREIEDAVMKSFTLEELRDSLKSMYPSVATRLSDGSYTAGL